MLALCCAVLFAAGPPVPDAETCRANARETGACYRYCHDAGAEPALEREAARLNGVWSGLDCWRNSAMSDADRERCLQNAQRLLTPQEFRARRWPEPIRLLPPTR